MADVDELGLAQEGRVEGVVDRRVRLAGSAVGRQSRIVRAGLVARMPSWTRMSWRVRTREQWTGCLLVAYRS